MDATSEKALTNGDFDKAPKIAAANGEGDNEQDDDEDVQIVRKRLETVLNEDEDDEENDDFEQTLRVRLEAPGSPGEPGGPGRALDCTCTAVGSDKASVQYQCSYQVEFPFENEGIPVYLIK